MSRGRSSANLLLAEYLFNEEIKRLFSGKPLIEFYLNPSERLHYNNYLNKGKPQPQKSFNPIHINPNVPFSPPGPFIGYPPMQGMMPPPFMPRPPNYPNPK